FPSSVELIHEPVAAMAGRFIQEVRNDTMVAREGYVSVIEQGMVAILALAAAFTHERRGVPPAAVGKVLGVVITKEELQAFRHALVDGHSKSVVVAESRILCGE